MSHPPPWIARLANDLSLHLRAVDVLSPLGCHFFHNRDVDQWEVSLFASRTQIVGGPYDGRERGSHFHVDLQSVASTFDHVHQFHWQAQPLGDEDELGPHVAIEGQYDGRSVWVRILADAPARFEAGRNVHAYDQRIEDTW